MVRYISLLLFIGLAWGQVTVDGYAYLENQTTHDSIQVLFERTVPSSLLDTTYTAMDGYYSIQIETGIYNVTFSKDGYFTESIIDQQFYSNTTLPDVSLLEHTTIINVPSDYSTIQAGINAAIDGDTVLVQPDTYVENINFTGKNIVVGSVYLTTSDTSYISSTIIDGNQNGSVATFNNGESSSAMLTGFTIQNGSGTPDASGTYNIGGGIYIHAASPHLSYLNIVNNYGIYRGGGIYLEGSNTYLNHLNIIGNSCSISDPSGGGIECRSSDIIIESTLIKDNQAKYGAGIQAVNSNLDIFNSTISNNSNSSWEGAGIYYFQSNGNCHNVVFTENYASDGSAFAVYDSNPVFEFCTIVNNNGWSGYVHGNSANPIIRNCIFYGNYNGAIKQDGGTANIFYSNFFNNGTNPFYGTNEWVGVNVTTNANGDSCDAYYNIQEDPLFVDATNGDYTLQPDSPCIDAGTADLDGDGIEDITDYVGLAPDMGAFEYGSTAFVNDPGELPQKYALHQNYPNPFNPVTTLQYDLPEDALVTITIYDMMGRVVSNLVSSQQRAGYKSVQWNATNDQGHPVSAGLYLYMIEAGEFRQTKKMVLLK